MKVTAKVAGKHGVVIGGASGIGAGIARALADAGSTVDIADLDDAGAERTAAALLEGGHDAASYRCDVSDPTSLAALVEQVRAARKRVDLLFVNAGAIVLKPFLEASLEDWRWLTGINLIGTASAVRAFLPDLLDQQDGARIVITSSVSVLRTADMAGQSLYIATKAGQLGMFLGLEAELKGSGVELSIVFPGPVATELRTKSTKARPDSVTIEIPASASKGMMSPDEAGRRIVEAAMAGQRYIATHPAEGARVSQRFCEILEAFAE